MVFESKLAGIIKSAIHCYRSAAAAHIIEQDSVSMCILITLHNGPCKRIYIFVILDLGFSGIVDVNHYTICACVLNIVYSHESETYIIRQAWLYAAIEATAFHWNCINFEFICINKNPTLGFVVYAIVVLFRGKRMCCSFVWHIFAG